MFSIVLPIHNQAKHVIEILLAYKIELEKEDITYELILVLNACTDDSINLCNALKKKDDRIKIIELEKGGWGLAVTKGIESAVGDLICYTNSARTQAETLITMIKYSLSNPTSVIKATRKEREGFRRRLGSVLYNFECRTLFDLPTWDINGTPKLFPSNYTPLKNLNRKDDLVDLEFIVTSRENRYPILEVPVFSTKRHSGKSTTNFKSAFKMYFGAIQYWLEKRRSS